MAQLASQVQQDPDEVFQQYRKTCSLDEVFGAAGKDKAMIASVTICLLAFQGKADIVLLQLLPHWA